MRRIVYGAVILASVCTVSTADRAFAETNTPTSAALEKQLAAHDPRAVAAARHYFQTPAIKTGLMAMVDNVNQTMLKLASQQNPGLTPAQLETIRQVVSDALIERLDLLIDMNMIVALDTFTPDELVAMDHFYSSPEGASILSKMPKLAAQMPALIQTIMPDYLNDVRKRIKAKGMELKL